MFKFLSILEKFLVVIFLITCTSMFCIKYRMFTLNNSLAYLDQQIEKLNENKNLFNIELTYLTSSERILNLIDKNPGILSNKEFINVSQLKTLSQFENISFAKAENRTYENSKVAKANIENIDDINELVNSNKIQDELN